MLSYAQFHLIGGVAHPLLGGEDDFRILQGMGHGDFLLRVHHLGGDHEAERAQLGQVHAHAHLHGVAHHVAQADQCVPHIALGQGRLAHDAFDDHLIVHLRLGLGIGVINRLSLAVANGNFEGYTLCDFNHPAKGI